MLEKLDKAIYKLVLGISLITVAVVGVALIFTTGQLMLLMVQSVSELVSNPALLGFIAVIGGGGGSLYIARRKKR